MLNHTLASALESARANTDALLECVCPGALYDRPIPERHRIVFYLGHLEAFDWNLICRGPLDVPAFEPELDLLFAFGIDPGADSLPRDQPSDWPAIGHVNRYRERVRRELDARLAKVPDDLLHVALEHRLMHAETFAYMLHQLPHERKIAPARSSPPDGGVADGGGTIRVPATKARLGRKRGDGFGWDNEFNAHTVRVQPFAIGRHKVTNREYLEFVHAGVAPPFFWSERQGEWWYRGMFEDAPLPLETPVYATHQEAVAYAAWKGGRLPSEAEWHAAAALAPPPDPGRDNFDFHYWDPIPAAASLDAPGPVQMTGNGWEWTSTVFGPFPGFAPFPFYPGYSANFFDGCHYVLKGASQRTAAALARPTFRNWFRPAYPYLYATFRVAKD